MKVDTHINFHLYHYAGNNPVRYVDPDGAYLIVTDNGDNTFSVIGGKEDSNKNIYIMGENGFLTGEIMGEMLTEHSFFDDGQLVLGALIDLNNTSGTNFINNFENNTPDLITYINNAGNGKKYDFKDVGKDTRTGNELNIYRHRGMVLGTTENGKKIIGSARDVGNYAAGYVAGKNGLYWGEARLGFDFYQSISTGMLCTEGNATQAAQSLGHIAGMNTPQGQLILKNRNMRMLWGFTY